MRLHRFYANPEDIELKHDFWLRDELLIKQWLKVLRYREGDQVVLFDGVVTERLYKIANTEQDAVKLELVTEFERKLPDRHVYLFFSLLKKDKNDWVLQKCTELGISNFIPLIAERSEKTGFNIERAKKIVIEASEQCGRSDIPHIREPLNLETVLGEYKDKVDLLVCDERTNQTEITKSEKPSGLLIGPEGGWTESELSLIAKEGGRGLSLGGMTLRAETAAVAASTKLIHFES